MNKRQKVELAIALAEKKLWQEQVQVNKHQYFLWVWRKRKHILLASIVFAPAIFMGIRTFGGAKFLLRLTRQVSNIMLAVAASRMKNSLWHAITHHAPKQLH